MVVEMLYINAQSAEERCKAGMVRAGSKGTSPRWFTGCRDKKNHTHHKHTLVVAFRARRRKREDTVPYSGQGTAESMKCCDKFYNIRNKDIPVCRNRASMKIIRQ